MSLIIVIQQLWNIICLGCPCNGVYSVNILYIKLALYLLNIYLLHGELGGKSWNQNVFRGRVGEEQMTGI